MSVDQPLENVNLNCAPPPPPPECNGVPTLFSETQDKGAIRYLILHAELNCGAQVNHMSIISYLYKFQTYF